jgi:hypothetical protein
MRKVDGRDTIALEPQVQVKVISQHGTTMLARDQGNCRVYQTQLQ